MKVYIVIQLNSPNNVISGVYFKEKDALNKMEELKMRMPNGDFAVISERVRTELFN
jgi:hypothetical protein